MYQESLVPSSPPSQLDKMILNPELKYRFCIQGRSFENDAMPLKLSRKLGNHLASILTSSRMRVRIARQRNSKDWR